MIGIIGAMEIEVENLISVMTDRNSETISGIVFYMGKIENTNCVVAKCGVGKVAAAVCAQTMILKYGTDALINVGVAGGIGKEIHIGDIVVSTGLVQHDMDTTALGDEKGLISGLNLVTIPASKRLSYLVAATAQNIYGKGVHTGIIATGDQFIGDVGTLNKIAEEFGASACEMEGGSIAQVCYMNQIEFVVIRAISDNANEAAKVDFPTFAASSARKSAELIRKVLPNI
ncbi:5'-methylthioadenosine/adenosylhomocysteine nucleosidase [Caproiciproducens galactitolivorans]|uniref:adenosylhomocysteine nucleosidase n=1 Tax=Caproiciproducens galactitolivorans TaxID=642589 RepID=A0A4Z0XW78_9FIRM|nr:5'-methylthioadenosine/adenosylhomocysteine nucleosidase [Caproiciproducens galactitolivorans]QEY34885.1 5'-methylthioadenosine/adenosylhomocysteine nucleosidase [Caproiciproducens galactitolivorans]TGJ75594.1 aminodeoxyfutalosine nucleosidase [Caproiciproducens galactitolivorans]